MFMIEFDGETIAQKVSAEPHAEYLTNVGQTSYTKTGSKTLEFYLVQSLRVTLWGELGDVLVKKKTKHAEVCVMVLTGMSGKEYNNKLYLSSTSSMVFCDDDDIPCLQELRVDDRYNLEVVVADDTTHTVIVMFNDTATKLLKCSAESLMGTEYENSDAEDELNLTIIPNASAEDGASSSTATVTTNDVESPVKIVTKPSTVCTPLKPNEGKKQNGHALEDSDVDEPHVTPRERPRLSQTSCKILGRLFQQYLVDAYTAVEEQRLKWTRNNQDTLRVDLYHNLCDAVTRGDTSAVGLGKRIILPRTFTGSQRYMMHTIRIRVYDNPDLFITFTSNPKWLEILEMLAYFPGQKPHDRPEIGTTIFKIKLTELLNDLTKKMCLVNLAQTPNEIDDIILVEMPSPTADPDRYKVVTDYMLHGPCGKDARNAACTNDGKCSKHFPKPFLAETFLDEDGYPHYYQRDNKVTFKKGKFMYDNKHVVPHNHYMLLKYKAHINVEWRNRSRAIKYLFKYLNKGLDRATVVIKENVRNRTKLGTKNVLEVDEIKNYLNCQFLAPCEAVWLFSFDINYSYPSVMQLSFHLPNQNAITLRDSEKLPALLQREGIDVTMFTDWFELIKCDLAARTLTYADIPKLIPLKLWEKTWKTLSEDILGKERKLFNYPNLLLTDEQIENYCLMEIKDLLHKYGRSLSDFKELPEPDPSLLTNMDNRLIRDALDFDIRKSKAEHQHLHSLLNPKQRLIYEDVIQSVQM
nr:hypothetical protein [Tanacetum cinerariifolium]